jgi:itaconate CoA-transferase
LAFTQRARSDGQALDLKSDDGLDALRRLVAKADVLVQNLAQGAAARMGWSYETLKSDHPRLIVCDIPATEAGDQTGIARPMTC